MKIFFVYLLLMHSPGGRQEPVTAFVREAPCTEAALALNGQVGAHRGYQWVCKKQGVER